MSTEGPTCKGIIVGGADYKSQLKMVSVAIGLDHLGGIKEGEVTLKAGSVSLVS